MGEGEAPRGGDEGHVGLCDCCIWSDFVIPVPLVKIVNVRLSSRKQTKQLICLHYPLVLLQVVRPHVYAVVLGPELLERQVVDLHVTPWSLKEQPVLGAKRRCSCS